MNIEFVKLVSGEEFVAEVSTDADNIIVNNPVVAIDQGQGLGFVPWCHILKQTTFTINKRDVLLTSSEFAIAIKAGYADNFGTKADIAAIEGERRALESEESRIITPQHSGIITP